jgi:signal transduction histidine kinase
VWPRSRAELLWRVRALLRLKREAPGPDVDGSELWRVQRDELLELQRRREETLTLLVHDMKNPLSGVISNAEFLCTGPELDAEQLASAQDIVQASRRLHRMVLSLLDVSLSDLGQLTLEPRPLDLRELVSETRATCSGRLRDKGVELVTIAPNAPPRVQGDRDMLLRLMANLVDNAIGASPAGAAIELAVVASPTDIDVHVSDSGPSLPPAELALMLDELSSSNVNEPKARARRGLGLRACRVITELHGGRIWVEDRQPQGARVCVRLPRSV